MSVTPEFRAKVVQYCLDKGTGVEYDEIAPDGMPCESTNKEKATRPAGKVRFIRKETIDWFLSEKVLPKTEYLIKCYDNNENIDLINFDEWLALCSIFGCNEMSYDDALKINGILWEYDITPMEVSNFTNCRLGVCAECKLLNANKDCNNCQVKEIIRRRQAR